MTSSTDIISPLLTISILSRLIKRSVLRIPDASRSPIMRSASRMAETSGVVTTTACSAPAIAFWNPCSIPAGQSSKTKSKSPRISSISFFICSGETADLSFVCADGSRQSSGNWLSFINACFNRQLPFMTSTIL